MDPNWILFFLVWGIAEFVQYLRKKPFRQRLKMGAIWATIITSLSMVGATSSEVHAANPWLSYAVALGINGLAALGIYWLRVGLAKGWSTLFNKTAP